MPLFDVDWQPGAGQLRTFGTICTVACAALGLWVRRGHAVLGMHLAPGVAVPVSHALWGIAIVSIVLAWAAPLALRPAYVVLTAITLPIGFVLSYVAAGVLFYLVLTPYGLAFRLMHRDPLERRIDRASASYWIRRRPARDVSRYFHQY